MKIYQKKFYKMNTSINNLLKEYRKRRNFNPESYLHEKAKLLNQYMRDCGLDTCVIALSGGLDSSITTGIASYAKTIKNSPIKKILALSIPSNNEGATNQEIATEKGLNVANHFNVDFKTIEIGNNINSFSDNICDSVDLKKDNWSLGQSVAYYRTATIYSVTAILTANNYRPIVIGTTNRDEGAYIGYFGKASDGMVDIQLISDIHKSEVIQLAKYFSLPDNIITDSPTGDMYDGRLDEEVFGVPYDFVEFYTEYLTDKDFYEQKLIELNSLDYFLEMSKNLENMHKYNGHKYLGASPAVHLDIKESRITNGWKYNVYNGKTKECDSPNFGNHKDW